MSQFALRDRREISQGTHKFHAIFSNLFVWLGEMRKTWPEAEDSKASTAIFLANNLFYNGARKSQTCNHIKIGFLSQARKVKGIRSRHEPT
jgi:hypothetical protein